VLTLRRGRVTAIRERHPGLARLEVDGRPCVAYPRLTGPVALGDDVVVNAQAVDLGLGSGGFDVLHVNLTRGLDLPSDPGAHVVKLPYTPIQAAALHAEEEADLPRTVAGLPVVGCTLHGQVVPACAGLGQGRRVAYVQVEGGALPVPLSDALRALRRRGLIGATVAVGACLDGDVACVTAASALAWVRREGFEAAVCAIGPGIVGTGSFYGHGGLGVAAALWIAASLQARPVLAPRVSLADGRARHHGLSHHSRALLTLVGSAVTVAWPAGLEPPADAAVETVDVEGWREACAGLPLESMGRGADEDPWLFAAGFAAGSLAGRMVS
jgi:hypothetical protein